MKPQSRLILAATIAAALVRLPGLFGDLWLDEVWSWEIAGRVHRLLDVFLIRHDNNHPLNTLWMSWAGPNAPAWAYRLPAFVCGVATVAVAVRIAARRGRNQARLTAVVFTLSYPLVHFSTEARGYGVALLCGLVAFDVLDRIGWAPAGWRQLWAYWVAGTVGLLAHLVFAQVLLAGWAWSLVRARQRAGPRIAVLQAVVLEQSVPAMALAALYVGFIRGMEIGGMSPVRSIEAVRATVPWFVGAPTVGFLAWLVTGAGVGALLVCMVRGGRERLPSSVFLITASLAAPVALWALDPALSLNVRYLLLPGELVLLAACLAIPAGLVGARARVRTMALGAGILVAVPLAWGTLYRDAMFLRLGRGQYRAALAYAALHTAGPEVSVGGSEETWFRRLAGYHGRGLGKHFIYRRMTALDGPQPEWLFLASPSVDFGEESAAPEIPRKRGSRYVLERSFRAFGLSGWTWNVYRLMAPPG